MQSSHASSPISTPMRVNHQYIMFQLHDGRVAVSAGMMTRLFQEGHIFKLLVCGGSGWAPQPVRQIIDLHAYCVTRRAFASLVFSLRNNDTRHVYKFRTQLDAIGGFKHIDKYHRKKMERKTKKTKPIPKPEVDVIDLTQDD